jgi:uncharacterized membrane protein YbhN (UPF0104 family)
VKVGAELLPIGLAVLLGIVVATTIGNVIAVLPAGLGTYEAGVVLILGAHGVSIEQAAPIGIALHLAHILIGAIGGAFVTALGPPRWREFFGRVKNLAKEWR